MIFESLWPLFFLAAVPVIIILYLLKPRGEDYRISSNLLWQKLLKNQQSKTFFEKFIHNILMYLQILIVMLLIVALMSPFIRMDGQGGGRKILLLDTSASMQHENASGKTRLEEAVELAGEYVRTMENTRFSVVTVDDTGVELLAIDVADGDSLLQSLRQIKSSDSGGSLLAAQGILDTLAGADAETGADLLVFTDGAGAADFDKLHSLGEKELYVVGEPTTNIANDYVVFSQREDGLFDVVVSLTNYSSREATADIGLYEEGEHLIALSQKQFAPSETAVCLFEGVDWQGQCLTAKVSGIRFSEGGKDSLSADNVSLVVKNNGTQINGLLVGTGNVFLEKAYQAVTGEGIAKADSDALSAEKDYNVVIYDAGQTSGDVTKGCLKFGDVADSATETVNNVVLDMTDCELTTGLSGFCIGVNKAYCFEVPEGAKSFLEYDGKCVGYYGEINGRKEVVVGFDIRESDFPLRAEFPVFLANAMIYLSDTSWLATNIYYAGEKLALQPWAEVDSSALPNVLDRAGLYQVGNEAYQESYVVRFQTATESDGQTVAETVTDSGQLQSQKVKHTLRNVFILLVLALLVLEWILYVRQMRYKGRFYLVVRGILMVCLLMALIGVQVRIGGNKNATIFLVDLSHSNEKNLLQAEQYLRKTIEEMPKGNGYGIVSFGKESLVEQFITDEKGYGGLLTMPEKTATNFEDAISKALTLIPADAAGRLVILTDGKETRGDIQRMAQALTNSQTELLTLVYENEVTQDAYVDNVKVPTYLHPGDKYTIDVMVESNYSTDAVIALYNGSSLLTNNRVHLNKGSNHFVFGSQVNGEADSNAMESLRVQVLAEGDGCEENNTFNAYSVVEAMPRVLVISGKEANTSAFSAVLNATGSDYSMVSALNAPDNIQAMLNYKAIILVDTYIDELPKGFLDNLESYVKDYGCGFVCCGGEDSFALGGYRDTVLETVLPVEMQLRSVNEMPSMAMVMVIDHSGSMSGSADGSGATNLDVAIKAATVAVDNLRDADYVGVLTFDDSYTWQVDLTQIEDRTAIKEKIKEIYEGGGTTIKPAVQEAYRVISQSEAAVKHVVLLTDGMGETNNYTDVIRQYSGSGVTLSTVAVGEGSDTALLEHLAKNCGGRYYYSDLSGDIPKIFAQEVFLGGDSYIQNGEFGLNVRKGHELTENLFAEGWPSVYGYVSSSPKTASSSIITSAEKDDPILTVWQYGLGRTVAWNSDVSGEWSSAFSGKEDYVQLWKRIVDYSTGNANLGEDRVDVVTAGELTEIVYETAEYSGNTEILATVIGPDGTTQEVKLHATAPGRFETELTTASVGMYHFNIRRMEDEEIRNYVTTAATVQFSDEYKFDVSPAAYLSFVEKYGRVITSDEDIWTDIKTNVKGTKDLTNWLLGIAIVLFLGDVAVRRFQYVPQWKNLKGRGKAVFENAKGVESVVDNPDGEGTKARVQSTEDTKSVANMQQSSQTQAITEQTTRSKKTAQKRKPPKQAEQTLDTSQLLKKKDDRNI